eukprot:PhM_4_TR14084/c2_g1_i2/m.107013/K20069/NECAP1_2; adaptin ear-binding coat-associated protein 1/2
MELVIFEAPTVHVFKLPPKSAAGYKAEQWEGNNIWTGICKVLSTEEACTIRLEDPTGKLFAECPINADPNAPKSVEPVTDSSRYFVIRVEDKKRGQHAFIGMGFDERSQAFDFSVALTDFKKAVISAKERAARGGVEYVEKEVEDMSLRSGEKIKVNLGGKVKTGEKLNAAVGVTAAGLARPTGGLAPPPGSKGKGLSPPPGTKPKPPSPQPTTAQPVPVAPPSAPTTTATTTTTTTNFDPFGFGSQQPAGPAPAASTFDPFGFGAPAPNTVSQPQGFTPTFTPTTTATNTTTAKKSASTFDDILAMNTPTSTQNKAPPQPATASKTAMSIDDLFKM